MALLSFFRSALNTSIRLLRGWFIPHHYLHPCPVAFIKNVWITIMRDNIDYVMITPSYPPSMGGVERHVSEIHCALKKIDLNGRIVVMKYPPADVVNDADIIWLPYRRFLGRVPKTASLCTAFKLARVLWKMNPKVIHFHDVMTYPMSMVLRLFGLLKKTYFTFHGWEGVFPPLPEVIRRRRKIAEMVMGSIAIGDFIKKWYGTVSNSVSYGGVDVNRFDLPEGDRNDDDILKMAYFGRFEPDTGVMEMVEAVKECSRIPGFDIRLDLYGKGSLKNRLLFCIDKSSAAITIHSPLNNISAVLSKYNIVVASGYLTIVEALCARRIVIAHYNNDLREDYLRLHPAASTFFICDGIDDFKTAISICREDHENVVAKAKAGWDWARQQSWEAVACQYTQLWRSSQ